MGRLTGTWCNAAQQRGGGTQRSGRHAPGQWRGARATEELEENDHAGKSSAGMIQLHRNQSPVDLVTSGCG